MTAPIRDMATAIWISILFALLIAIGIVIWLSWIAVIAIILTLAVIFAMFATLSAAIWEVDR